MYCFYSRAFAMRKTSRSPSFRPAFSIANLLATCLEMSAETSVSRSIVRIFPVVCSTALTSIRALQEIRSPSRRPNSLKASPTTLISGALVVLAASTSGNSRASRSRLSSVSVARSGRVCPRCRSTIAIDTVGRDLPSIRTLRVSRRVSVFFSRAIKKSAPFSSMVLATLSPIVLLASA